MISAVAEGNERFVSAPSAATRCIKETEVF
jgi:hypothetical protein